MVYLAEVGPTHIPTIFIVYNNWKEMSSIQDSMIGLLDVIC